MKTVLAKCKEEEEYLQNAAVECVRKISTVVGRGEPDFADNTH